MTVFLGIYRAIYDYEPQTPEELAIHEDDLLYLLQKSDIDDWWTVKRRVIGSDSDEPVGLVPSTYIEEAPILKKVRAIYDYEQVQNADEELTFHENDVFNVLDDKDPDWLLVKSTVSNEFGFIPGNYVEGADDASSKQEAAPTAAPAAGLPTSFLPPPQHIARKQPIEQDRAPEEEDEGPPPAMPARPRATTETTETTAMAAPARNRLSYSDNDIDDEEDYNYYNENNNINNNNSGANREYNTEYHSWNVTEIEGRKKKKAKLSIGNNKINFIPQKGAPHEWSIDKLVSYDNEKKHMFLEFVDPYRSLELHTGNTTTCEEIMNIIGEYKGASRDPGLKEVEMASKSKKRGVAQYDFLAESQDELTIKSGDKVYILDDKKSSDWWMCQLIDSGKSGLVPAQFVEPVRDKKHTESTASGIIKSIKKNFTKSPSRSRSRSRSKSNANASWKDDESQNDTATSTTGARSRKGSLSSHKKNSSTSGTKDFPNPKKSRLWVDRSGTFKVDAEFIGCAKGKIHLHKVNGVKIAVAADKLCNEDLAYVEKITGFSLEKFKIHDGSSSGSRGTDSRDSERERRRRLKEQEEKERDRRLKERELYELKKARELLDEERSRLQEKELPPIKPPRPTSSVSASNTTSQSVTQNNNNNGNTYDWFEFFLNCGVDVSNCQRYTINFDREQITEDMMPDIDNSMLRTLGLREGDIVRVTKYLDKKFGKENNTVIPTNMTGNMFSQPDGSLNPATNAETSLPQQLLPQSTAPIPTAPSASAETDDAWTVKPASKSESNLLSKKSEFTGSMQDLLDLQPLEPKKTSTITPEPNLKDLQPVKTGGTAASVAISSAPTPAPLDPFKTGGNNILPLSTGYVMMPMITGGAMLPMQRTGGFVIPQTTFGMQQQATGGILPVQKTSNGLIAISNTGGAMMPQTTFGATPTILPLQKTGGGLIPIATGGVQLPQTSFNIQTQQQLPIGSILPVQKTANGLISTNTGISMPPLQRTGGTMIAQPQITGGAMMPQTSFGVSQQFTGNAMMAQPQITGGALNTFNTGGAMIPQTSFGVSQQQFTGNAMMAQPQRTGGALNTFNTGGAMIPQTSFNAQPQITGGFQPQSQFGLTLQKTGGIAPLSQNQFTGGAMNTFNTGGVMQQQQQQQPQMMTTFNTGSAMQQPQMMNTFNTGGAMQQPQMMNTFSTGGAMQQPQMMNTFNTGGAMQQPQVMSTFNTGGAMQQPQQQALQNQPTGFGFGNGPPQSRQANIFNATASNPFGF